MRGCVMGFPGERSRAIPPDLPAWLRAVTGPPRAYGSAADRAVTKRDSARESVGPFAHAEAPFE
jgi:hypothetical protein